MDSITEAYNRMYLPQVLTEGLNLLQIIKQTPKAAAAWPKYQELSERQRD